MSFYTSLTGLNAATTQLSVTSNNIANVSTTGFKRSRADFGDIFATSPLQKASSVIGQGVALKSVSQEFSQGNIQFSANSLDLAITGDGFFPLKSADNLQDIYTRNGTFVLNDSFAVVNSAGQSLMAATVDSSGKADLNSLKRLIIPRATVGDAVQTSLIELGLNLPADARVISSEFNRNDPSTYNLTTAVTVFDQGGNEYLATVFYAKTQVASPENPFNKWQTHVFIGETKLEELLIQAKDSDEKLFVNKYGEIRRESQINPAEINGGVSKLFNLDDLNNPQQSVPATAAGSPLPPQLTNEWKSGAIPRGLLEPSVRDQALTFDLSVDGAEPVTVDLTFLTNDSTSTRSFTGVEIAREITNAISKAYGDERFFDFSPLKVDTEDNNVNLFEIALVTTGASPSASEPFRKINLSNADIEAKFPGATAKTLANLTANEAAQLIEDKLRLAAPDGLGDSTIRVAYDPVLRSFTFNSSTTPSKEFVLRSATTSNNEFFNLSTGETRVDPVTGAYAADLMPRGAFIVPPADQRYGITVTFDDTTRRFLIASGSTGDTSSVSISKATANAKTLFGFPTAAEEPVFVDTSRTPLRGITSSPAVLSGNPIGINVNNKFRVDGSNNQFVVTVNNVTGVVTMPERAEYTIEEFRRELEFRINSLTDNFGRSVNGVKVDVQRNALGQSFFNFTTGTTGNDAFLKVSANSIWGLSDLPSARGTTSRWVEPPQARNAAGFPLYVNRDGLETSDPGDFSEIETADLWSPIFLDKGELTFNTNGNLRSPTEAIQFKASTIGETGATLQFAINYTGSTQFSSPFSVLAQNQNGRPEGDLIGLNIGDDGLVSANYSNGTQKNLAKIILANFTAPTGLRQLGDSSYLATSQSGRVTLGEAGAAGFGTVRAGATERANVDLTQELIELITAQRNFQANAKAIETNNTLTQAIINIRS
jgi:flagellar hook-basal body protein